MIALTSSDLTFTLEVGSSLAPPVRQVYTLTGTPELEFLNHCNTLGLSRREFTQLTSNEDPKSNALLKRLEDQGFQFIGCGKCSRVYRYQDSDLVLKVSVPNPYDIPLYNPRDESEEYSGALYRALGDFMLPYLLISPNQSVAIQPFCDASLVARHTAIESPDIKPHLTWFPLWNLGTYHGHPVLFDAD